MIEMSHFYYYGTGKFLSCIIRRRLKKKMIVIYVNNVLYFFGTGSNANGSIVVGLLWRQLKDIFINDIRINDIAPPIHLRTYLFRII